MKKWILFGMAATVAVAGVVCAGNPAGMRDPGAGYAVPDLGPLSAGQIHWGEGRYIEYTVGSLPLILSAPHGGTLTPSEIPNRTRGYPIGDSGSQELTRLVSEALVALTGEAPHMVISRLSRKKLDPNREPDEAANGDPIAHGAWLEYHGFIDAAKREVTASWGAGLYLDMHGHGHRTPWVELGYLAPISILNDTDEALDNHPQNHRHSLRAVAEATSIAPSALLRGPTSLGALLESRGYRSVPSPGDPGPGRASYFNGGYSTYRHGSSLRGTISSIQVEHPKKGVRDTDANRRAYAPHLAAALVEFMEAHYGFTLPRANT